MKRQHKNEVDAEVSRHDEDGSWHGELVCGCGKPYKDWTQHVDREMWKAGYDYARQEALHKSPEFQAVFAELVELRKATEKTPEQKREEQRAKRLATLKTPQAGDFCAGGSKHHDRCTIGVHDFPIVSEGKGWTHAPKKAEEAPGTPFLSVTVPSSSTTTTSGNAVITFDGDCPNNRLHRAHLIQDHISGLTQRSRWCSGGHPVVSCLMHLPHTMHATEAGDLCRGVDR